MQTFLLTNIAYSWTLLPCTPNCGSSINDNGESHHATTHTDPHTGHSNHNVATAQNDPMMPCGSCGGCDDIYTSLFNLLVSPENNLGVVMSSQANAKFILHINSRTPDPYRTPPA